MAALPTGTVTFLFTDVEGSTLLWEQQPQSMRAALVRHDALILAGVEAHGGVIVRSRGEGDSFFAVFARASDAVAAACQLQRLLADEPWPTTLPLRVRLALHTGEADLRDGDYYGAAVNRCARLRAVAHGGQTLLTLATAQLARETLPAGAGVQDLGEYRLRDLVQPERVFQLLQPGLSADFPPLKSLDTFPHNLPLQLTSFVGREREMAEVTRMLTRARLLTLTGTGGCGKTRLALQVAADLMDRFADGVWLVELAPLADPALVSQAVAAALGVREAPGQPLLSTLLAALKAKRLLLVLDNCEHLIDASAQVVDALLRGCPSLNVMATSREMLGVASEVAWRVPSLAVPDPRRLPPVERLQHYEAVRLFVERARLVQPAFAMTHQNAPALAQVCHRLDGIPLAIELAAARVRLLAVEQIATRLDDCFRLLSGGSRTALPRQQTLRAAIDWSYDLLSETERVLLRRLSVFAAGFNMDAAEAVCGGAGGEGEHSGMGAGEPSDAMALPRPVPRSPQSPAPSPQPPPDVMDVLALLIDKSLVQVEEQGGEARYRLLETIRQYGRDRLQEAGEVTVTRARHRDWYLALTQQAEPELWGAHERLWLDRLELEHDNLRAALDRCLATDTEAGLCLAGSLWRFWELRGYLTEGRAWLEGMLARDEALHGARTAARAKALLGAGYLARDQGDLGAARPRFNESLSIFRELGDHWGIGSVLRSLGVLALSEGDYRQARALFDETLARFRAIGHTLGVGWTLRNLGMIAQTEGDYARAAALFEESLPLLREIGDRPGMGRILGSLGILARLQGEHERAKALLEESLALVQAAGDKRGIAMALGSQGSLARIQGDQVAAQALLARGLALGQEVGDTLCIAHGLGILGVMAIQRSALTRGVQLIGAAMATHTLLPMSLASDERAALDAALTAAKATLNAPDYTRAWALGQAMTADEAITYALKPSDAPAGVPATDELAPGREATTASADARAGVAPVGIEPSGHATAAAGAEREAGGAADHARGTSGQRLPGGLTGREAEVLRLVAQGKTNREIAADLSLSEYTVMRHLSNIFNKIGVSSRAAAASFAVREGIS